MEKLSEFEVIKKYFSFSKTPNNKLSSVLLGIGDDAAIVAANPNPLVIATDSLIEKVHFPENYPSQYIASRSLGVNISDFAAMGVEPKFMTMSLGLPKLNHDWLESFSTSMKKICDKYNLSLVGGDTTRADNIIITLTLFGFLPDKKSKYLVRSGAEVNDDIWVTGSLGKGAAALALIQSSEYLYNWDYSNEDRESLIKSFNIPEPRLSLGVAISSIANSAIDISDGLFSDAQHISDKSMCKFVIDGDQIPIHRSLKNHPNSKVVQEWVLHGGDDYEILFTAPPEEHSQIVKISNKLNLPCTQIGKVTKGRGVTISGEGWNSFECKGYEHFKL